MPFRFDLLEYVAGAISALAVGGAMAWLNYRLSESSRRIQRRVETAEMVGAVQGEMRGLVREVHTVGQRLGRVELTLATLDDRLDEHMESHTHRSAVG
ncbi:MAG: hypothetical protein GWN29_04865 [Gammaproteobacteria bacterium]|nr:hypothetical protein [Gammaproteobacteria bacterium]NIV51086.1 hypothetical protein [Gammaproteobacteria bacterium]NIW23937.1 hypothetical protein [Gammaproteobacteria bacterium]NIX85029.1 hypothetical protein [Gammaproteobacteria bacterium]